MHDFALIVRSKFSDNSSPLKYMYLTCLKRRTIHLFISSHELMSFIFPMFLQGSDLVLEAAVICMQAMVTMAVQNNSKAGNITASQGCESSDFNLNSDFFCSSQNHIFRLLMQFECIDKHPFLGISGYFRLFLTEALTPLASVRPNHDSDIVMQVFPVLLLLPFDFL